MFYDIYRYVKNAHPNIQIDISQDVRDVVKPSLEHCEIYDKLNLNLRDYQIETVSQALKFGRGIIKLGTGGGKTLTIASLLSSLYNNKGHTFKCLLIVPDLTLVNQTYNDFNEYGVKFKTTRWTGSIDPDFTANVIIANLGILQSQFVNEEWLTNVDALIVDECHKLKKGNKACKIVKSIKTINKFGLTGTLPDTKIDEWNIVGLLGSVFYEKNSYELRTENYLTNAEIKIIKIKYVSKVQYIQGANKFRTELDFIYNNSYRNNVIKAISNKCNNNDNNS
jgi:superfamily II DNA or RNA helicase